MRFVNWKVSIFVLRSIFKAVIEFIYDGNDASKEKNDLLQETIATQPVLSQLKCRVNDKQCQATIAVLNMPQGPFDLFMIILKSLEAKLKPPSSKWSKGTKSLTWPFTKGEVDTFLSRLQRIKELLDFALQNEHMFLLKTLFC